MSEYRKELEKYLTMPNAHINCAENTSMALTDALGIGGGLEDARYMAAFGGGMGCGSVCGALIGAESALGRYMVSRLPEGARELLGDGASETYSAETGQETFTLSSLEQLEQIEALAQAQGITAGRFNGESGTGIFLLVVAGA